MRWLPYCVCTATRLTSSRRRTCLEEHTDQVFKRFIQDEPCGTSLIVGNDENDCLYKARQSLARLTQSCGSQASYFGYNKGFNGCMRQCFCYKADSRSKLWEAACLVKVDLVLVEHKGVRQEQAAPFRLRYCMRPENLILPACKTCACLRIGLPLPPIMPVRLDQSLISF